MKTLTKTSLCGLYKYSGAMLAQERLAYWAGRRFMTIALFHRVTDEVPPDGLTVDTAWFRGFCEMLRDRFHVVRLEEVMRLLAAGEAPPRRTIAITFDDCYRDNLPASRVLAEHGLPATFFIPPPFVGTDHVFPWDRDLPRLANLTWDEVFEMVSLGHDIGSHSMTHADFGVIGPDQARRELTDSRKMLEDKLQRPVRWFAYPFGGKGNFKPEYLPLVYEAGYGACFSGHTGFVEPGTFGRVIPREPMPSFPDLLNLEVHLTGCLDWFYRIKRRAGMSVPHLR